MIYSIYALVLSALLGAESTTIRQSKMSIKNSEVMPGNLLPTFLFMQSHTEGGSTGVTIGGGRGSTKPFVPDDSAPDDIWEGANLDMRPYLTQDLWTCDRTEQDIFTYEIETENLKATITPQYGGKIWNLLDKRNGKDWFYNNKAHQPANIAALKAWTSGGCEWNWSPGIVGHSAFTESPVWMGKVQAMDGDKPVELVRVYEYDRYNSTVWQVDIYLDEDNDALWAHPKITNPTLADVRGYWWTCVAVDSKPTTRVLSPATWTAETSRDPMRAAPWPYFTMGLENTTMMGIDDNMPTDSSYLANIMWGDFFLRIPADQVYTPYIAHVQKEELVSGQDFVVVHGHPLNGTKFFSWGQNGPGRFMQDFLGGGATHDEGDYTELQVGPAPTQMQTFSMPASSSKQWTEWFKGFWAESAEMHAADYVQPLKVIDDWMKADDGSGMLQSRVKQVDDMFTKYADVDMSELLFTGSVWGALEQMIDNRPLKSGLMFGIPEADAAIAQPWVELLNNGTFSQSTLESIPLSYQTTDKWMNLVYQSAEKHGYTWLHYLYLGVGLMERGDINEPMQMLSMSFKLMPNPVAARCLALLQTSYEDAWVYYGYAWDSLVNPSSIWSRADQDSFSRLVMNLANEMSYFLQTAEWDDVMEQWLNAAPAGVQELDSFLLMRVKVLLNNHAPEDAKKVLSTYCFPTFGRARADLLDAWFEAVEMISSDELGHDLNPLEGHQARMKTPPPRNIGCPYADWYCIWYW